MGEQRRAKEALDEADPAAGAFIDEAKALAAKHGLDGVVILVMNQRRFRLTTHGKDSEWRQLSKAMAIKMHDMVDAWLGQGATVEGPRRVQ